jgi:integrase
MRIGEIRALRICDIHEKYIYVEHNWSAVDGGLKKTKNKKTREVPIMPELYEEILAYITKFQLGTRLDGFLFPGVYSDSKPYSLEKIERDFKDALGKIGIDEAMRRERKIVFHSWRHFMAKNLAQVTTRNIAKKILGQETDSVFERYANHVDKETFIKMAEAVRQRTKGEAVKPPLPFPQSSGK